MKIFNKEELKQTRRVLRNNATPQEVILWSRLKNSNLGYKFRRQQSLGNYIVDFYCKERKLIVEIDGSQHDDRDAKIYDVSRSNYFKSFGFNVLRFWNNEINTNIQGIVMMIEEELQKR